MWLPAPIAVLGTKAWIFDFEFIEILIGKPPTKSATKKNKKKIKKIGLPQNNICQGARLHFTMHKMVNKTREKILC